MLQSVSNLSQSEAGWGGGGAAVSAGECNTLTPRVWCSFFMEPISDEMEKDQNVDGSYSVGLGYNELQVASEFTSTAVRSSR